MQEWAASLPPPCAATYSPWLFQVMIGTTVNVAA
jgi:hypothetical protein